MSHPRAIIAGDLNCKHQYFGCRRTNGAGDKLFAMIEHNDLVVMNNPSEATVDVLGARPDIVDYVLATTAASKLAQACYVGEHMGSDHFPVHLHLRVVGGFGRGASVMSRTIDRCDWPLFKLKLDESFTADAELNCEQDIDNRCAELTQSVTIAIDLACPLKPRIPGAFRVSNETLKLIKAKRKMRRMAQRCNDPYVKRAYNALNNRVQAAVALERRNAWRTATEDLNSFQGAKLWRRFNSLTETGKSNSRVKAITDSNGSTQTDETVIAEVFAAHLGAVHATHEGPEYCDVTRTQIETEINSSDALFRPCFSDAGVEPGDDHFLAEVIHPDDVHAALKQCKSRSAAGQDGVSYAMLKQSTNLFVAALAHLFTACLLAGYFPRAWKEAVGVMLLKPGKAAKLPSSYRPISLLGCMGKLFERIIATRLHAHLSEINF